MATKVIIPTNEEITIVTKNNEIFPAMNILAGIYDGDKEAASKIVCSNSEAVNDAWRQVKLLEKVVDYAKKTIEAAMWEISDKEELAVPASMQKDFKWQQGAKKTVVSNVPTLFEIAEGNGVTAKEMGSYIKSINAKDAAKMLGMSDEAFLGQFGYITTTTQNKPTLKGL